MPGSKNASAVPKRIIKWNERVSRSFDGNRVPVWIDVRKLDALLPLASNMTHVGPAGENGIFGKYAGVDEIVRSQEYTALDMPEVEIELACEKHPDQDIVYIINGRHRFAWMRDHGARALPVAVPASEASEVARLIGTEARVCRVSMSKIPEFPAELIEKEIDREQTKLPDWFLPEARIVAVASPTLLSHVGYLSGKPRPENWFGLNECYRKPIGFGSDVHRLMVCEVPGTKLWTVERLDEEHHAKGIDEVLAYDWGPIHPIFTDSYQSAMVLGEYCHRNAPPKGLRWIRAVQHKGEVG